jgi:hypothetical protein
MRPTTPFASSPSTVASAERSMSGSSRVPVVVNCANCSARSAASSSSGASSRVATIARQPGEVALSRGFGVIWNGIEKRRKRSRPSAERVGV